MNHISSKIRLGLGFFLFFVLTNLFAQPSVNIATTEIGPNLHIILTWRPFVKASGYRIYRKEISSVNYDTDPINTSPLVPVTDCNSIKLALGSDAIVLERGLADTKDTLFNLCLLPGLDHASEKYQRFIFLAESNLKIAKIAGLVFEDNKVVSGKTYAYKIMALNNASQEIGTVAKDVTITAGKVDLPAAPERLEAEAGDNEVLLRWSANQHAFGYNVYRSTTPLFFSGKIINPNMICTRVSKTLSGDTLTPSMPGFLDFQRWDALGMPIDHKVLKQNIDGPSNGVTYYYRVQSVDMLGRLGSVSNFVFATPKDNASPATPSGLKTDPDDTAPNGKVTITFIPVILDENGHEEQHVIKYEVRRFASPEGNPDSTPSTSVGGSVILKGGMLYLTDNFSGLRGQFGDRIWYYRIQAIDQNGNKSRWSAAAIATLKDISKPSIPTGLKLEGEENGVALKSIDLSPDPDILEYQVFRSFCDYGEWKPCPEKDANHPPDAQKTTKPCSGPFIYIGTITQDSVTKARKAGHPFVFDHSIPPGSPLCYAYWVKAVDRSGNISGQANFPNPEERAQIVCERMRDRTPPEAAIITGLFSRDKAIQVEFIAPPMQDVRAYYVLRAKETSVQQEPSVSDFKWVGGLAVDIHAPNLAIINAPLGPSGNSSCDLIPVEATEKMTSGSFLDVVGVEPNTIYWYKVSGVDYEGNETPLDKAVAVSTFTYSSQLQGAPFLASVKQEHDTCGIRLSWSPTYDSNLHKGFLLFKSPTATGSFLQVGSLLKENSYFDLEVVNGRKYWYKLAILQFDGKISQVSGGTQIEVKP